MAGMLPGPAAKPDDVRQRANQPASGEQTVVTPEGVPSYVDMVPEPPEPPAQWHPRARAFYDRLLHDPARMTMTGADWELAMFMLENLHRSLQPQVVATIPSKVEDGIAIPGDVIREPVPMNGSQQMAFLRWAAMVGITEGARRALGIHVKLGVTTETVQGGQPVGVVKSRADLMLVPPPEEEQG